jgi:D-alanyl-D-alanine carboxypeptidase
MSPATPFGLAGPTVRDGHLIVNAQVEYAGGGMISNAGDLAHWAKLLWEGKAFSAAMLEQVLDAKPTGTGRGGGRDAKYGLAVQVQPSEFGLTYGHAGWFPGYQTEMVYFPDQKIAVAIQVNADPVRGTKKSPRACLNEIMRLVSVEVAAAPRRAA